MMTDSSTLDALTAGAATLNKSLVAPAVNTSNYTYYVRFVLANGSVETLGGRSLYQLSVLQNYSSTKPAQRLTAP
jgi:hypothetical protein